MQQKSVFNPKYVPVYLKDDCNSTNGHKRKTHASILIILLTICIGILFGIYIFIISPFSYSSYKPGCCDYHRGYIYSKVPEDNITIPKIEVKGEYGERNNFKLVCYYNFASNGDSDELQIGDLDPHLCTHLNVGFANVENDTIVLTEGNEKMLRKVVELKRVNKELKILLSVGGSGSCGFSLMVRNHTTRKIFIQSILNYTKTYKIDGVDLDWEFPNENGIFTKERMHFTQLLYEIRKEINRQRKHRFLITIAVAAPYFVAMNSYDINYISDYVDYVNIMTYDFHFYTKLTPFTGINSPLYSLPHDVGIFGTLNINYSVNFWFSQGMPKEKIVIGLPTYGHTYKLINRHNNGISAPAIGYGDTGHNGFLDYGEVCRFMSSRGIIPNFDEISKSPYLTAAYEWISYDDTKSLTYKAEYIKNNNFGGAMVYSLNSDDYRNWCNAPSYGNKTKFPLIQTIRDVLINPKY